MIISRLDLKAFGRFTDVSLDLSAGPRRFHLIYGPNESGKSTSLRAITSLLFGMPHITDDNYLHTNAQMRVGGLLVDESGTRLECVRRRGRKATLRDADDDQPIDESQIEEMLGGINRETFLTRFGLSHDELLAGGAAVLSGEGDLGQILFAAGAGIGKLREIQDELDAAGSRLFTPRGSKTAVNAAIREIDEKRKQLRKAQVPPAEFSDLRQRIENKRAESTQSNELLQACAITLARLRSYEQALPLLPPWRATIESLKEVKSTPLLDEAFTERRRQAISDREVASSRQVELETRIAELTARVEALPVDTAVMNHEAEIQAVFQEVAARDKADRDRLDLVRVQKNSDRKIIDQLRELSVEIRSDDDAETAEAIEESVERLRLSDALRMRIRELASGYERLIAQRNDASDAVETTKRRLADASNELESLANVGDPAVLGGAIDAVGNPQAMLESISDQQQSCDGLRRRCEDLLRRLEGFDGTLEQATRLRPPSETATQKLAETLRTTYQRVLQAEEQRKNLNTERDELQRQIRDEQTDQPLPTSDELADARQRRDRATDRVADWARHGATQRATAQRATAQQATTQRATASQTAKPGDDAAESDNDPVEELRRCIRLTDQLADTMRMHHEQVHRRAMLISRAAALDTRIGETEAIVAARQQEFEAVKQEWVSLWKACGVTAGQPERMQRWLTDHEQLCEQAQRLVDEEKRLEQSQQRIGRAASRLRSVLAATGSNKPISVASTFQGGLFDDPPEDDLVELYDEAVTLRSQWMRARQKYDALSRRRDELSEELPQAETRFETAQKNVEQWREDWRRTTESFVQSDRAGAREVLQMLDRIGELCNRKRERDILAKRIRSIGEDELAYAARVKRLAAATGVTDVEDQPPTAVAQTLYQRLQAERTATRGRETLREQIDSSRQRLSDLVAQRKACEVVLKQLCAEAGCEKAEQLPEIERAARERTALQATLRDLENQLSILAADQPIVEFIDAAGKQQLAVLAGEIEQKTTELAELREKSSLIQQEIGALQHELDLMDGSSRAAELVQSIQLTAGQISRDAEEYARTAIASLLLRRAIDHYRKENQSPVLANANRFFAQLTCGEYRELKPDYDAKGKTTLFGINSAGTAVPAGVMSVGTADALYLALRLASLEHQISQGKAIPLIIDDCLIQLDDARAAAALRAFSTLSEKTQVILFTHHHHLRVLAEQHLESQDFHLHQLSV